MTQRFDLRWVQDGVERSAIVLGPPPAIGAVLEVDNLTDPDAPTMLRVVEIKQRVSPLRQPVAGATLESRMPVVFALVVS